MPIYSEPLEITSGQTIGKAYLGQLTDNRRYSMGLVARWEPIQEIISRTFVGGEKSLTIWYGWHYHDGDCDTVNYRFSLANADASTRVKMYYDGALVDEASDGQTKDSTYDISAKAAALYQVYFALTRTNTTDDGTGIIYPTYSTYTGAKSYTAPPAFTDGTSAAASDFNDLRSNDMYFWEIRPRQAPGMTVRTHTYQGNEDTHVLWSGYFKYQAERRQFYYHVKTASVDENNADDHRIQIIADPDGINETVMNLQPAGWDEEAEEDSHTLTGGFVEDTWYEIRCQLYRTSTDNGGWGTLDYLFQTQQGAAVSTDPGAWTVGDIVYGSTTIPRLDLLSGIDITLNTRITRLDYAVRDNIYASRPGFMGEYEYHFKRRGDFLYYRGRGGKIRYLGKSVTLRDTGDEEAYVVYDLNQATGLHYGMIYYIEGTMEYAMEM